MTGEKTSDTPAGFLKKCPRCREDIPIAAEYCGHCGLRQLQYGSSPIDTNCTLCGKAIRMGTMVFGTAQGIICKDCHDKETMETLLARASSGAVKISQEQPRPPSSFAHNMNQKGEMTQAQHVLSYVIFSLAFFMIPLFLIMLATNTFDIGALVLSSLIVVATSTVAAYAVTSVPAAPSMSRDGYFILALILIVVGAALIALPLIPISESSTILNESFVVPESWYMYRRVYNSSSLPLRIMFNVTEGGDRSVDFYVMTESDFNDLKNNQSFQYYTAPSRKSVTALETVWTPPPETLYYVWDNPSSTPKHVTARFQTEYNPVRISNNLFYGWVIALGGVEVCWRRRTAFKYKQTRIQQSSGSTPV